MKHEIVHFIAPPGHGPDWLWLIMGFLAFMAVVSYRREHGRDR